MKLITFGAAVLNQTPLDWEHNKRNIIDAIEEARAQGVTILCLPEMCITGYGCEDAFLSAGVLDTAREILFELIPHSTGMILSVGIPVLHHNSIFNTACLLVDGEIAGFTAKRFLPGDGIHYEHRWFKPWPENLRDELHWGDKHYPIGDIFYDIGGVRIGFEICEDAWVGTRPGVKLSSHSVDVILNPSASHFAFGKRDVRRRYVLEGSRAFNVTYVYANPLGNEAGRAIYDGGALIASNGSMAAIGPRFSFRDFVITSATVDISLTRMAQARIASFRPEMNGESMSCIRRPFSYPEREKTSVQLDEPDWEQSPSLKAEEFTRTVALGLFDYMRKSHSNGFVVSLSGGADSAAVACLVMLMADLAVQELGFPAFREKLPAALQKYDDAATLKHALLTCVYQATRHNSETTRAAADQIAAALGAEFHTLQIDAIVDAYLDLGKQALRRELTWEQDDIALQNIQARVRAPGVWLLANIKGALLLSTSNRSEAAVGYATMDGDTSGGLSPIAGIDKQYLRQWLRWLEKHGPVGLSPIPALSAINAQQPTAELRPQDSGQTDESDLMPYDVLDRIERLAIRDKRMPAEVFRIIRHEFTSYSESQLVHWVDRFFRLWSRNQWKRERYAPSFHLDDENLDPKTWCRFPILSGGFERELESLNREFSKKSEAGET